MKKLNLLIVLLIPTIGFAQKMNVVKGDFKFLLEQKDVNVEFHYSNLLGTLMQGIKVLSRHHGQNLFD